MKQFKAKTGSRSLRSSLTGSAFSPKNSIDEAYKMIEKALVSDQSMIGPEYAKDEINAMARDGWGPGHSLNNSIHPIDSAFDSLKKLLQESSPIAAGKDEINDFAKDLNVNVISAHSLSDIFNLIEEAYFQSNKTYAKDPVNELVEGFSTKQYSGKPKHSLQEFNDLLESSYGLKKFTSSDFADPVNAELQSYLGTGTINNEPKTPTAIKEAPVQINKSVNPLNANISKPKDNLSTSTVNKVNVSSSDLEGELIDEVVTKITAEKFSNKKVMEALRKTVRRPK